MAVTTTAPDTAVLRNATAVYKGYWPARELRQFHQNLYTITTLAVDTVYIHDNNTFFSDRDLANRLSLVPIVSGQRYWRRSVTCYGPANDRLALTPVYADQIFGDSTPFKDILICELQNNQHFDVTIIASPGRGEEHIRFLPGLIWSVPNPEGGTILTVQSFGILTPETIAEEIGLATGNVYYED